MTVTAIRRDGLMVKIEGSYGVDPTPVAAANGVRMSERLWSNIAPSYQHTNLRDDASSGSLLPVAPSVPRGKMANVTVFWEARGFGSAYSASNLPEAHPLIRSCGYSQAVDTTGGSEKVTYAPASSAHESCTIYAEAGTLLYKVVGCRGNMTISAARGELAICRFDMQGILAATTPITDQALESITYNTQLPPQWAAASALVISSHQPDCDRWEYDAGASVQLLGSGNAADAISQFAISSLRPMFRPTVYSDSLANWSVYSIAGIAGPPTLQTIDVTVGNTQYNRMKLDVNTSYLQMPANVDLNEHTAFDLEYRCLDGSIIFD